jgi:hypothetical protein
MSRSVLALVYYIFATAAVVVAHRMTEPTMGGPGLNFYTFIVVLILSFFLMIRTLRISVLNDKESFMPFYIHLAGMGFIVYLIFFDHLLMARA